MKINIKTLFTSVKKAFSGFFDDRGLKLSASLSYYTVFSLPSLLFMLIGLGGLFLGKEAIQGEIFRHIAGYVGPEAAEDIQNMLQHTSINKSNIIATVVGGLLLWFTAAGVFVEIQDSINFIWGIKPKPKKGLKTMVINRLISFSMILVLGFILMVSMFLVALLHSFIDKIKDFFPESLVNTFFVVDYLVMLVVIVTLFAAIFKLLPDAVIKVKEVLPGAIFTSVLFFLGQFLIGFYLNKFGNVKVYGPASSLILIILWVYYSAIILYLGAEFTKAHMIESGKQINPVEYAELVDDKLNRGVENRKVEENKGLRPTYDSFSKEKVQK
jgi:membrane protein